MADRPILFSAPMVRALLAGTKTQTRRILKAHVPTQPGDDAVHPKHSAKHPHAYLDSYCGERGTPDNPRGMSRNWCWWTRDDRPGHQFKVPYVPGDRLWVKETWRARSSHDGLKPSDISPTSMILYEADGLDPSLDYGKLRQSMFMPRWASRLTLVVTDVRVQRLQDISEKDIYAEGAITDEWLEWREDVKNIGMPSGSSIENERQLWERLWRSINGAGSWDANPFVVAVTFSAHRCNIDALQAQIDREGR